MENFDWTSFTRKIAVKAELSTLYNAWTRSDEIEKWFLSNAGFYSGNGELRSKDQNVEEGDAYKWSWYLYDVVEEGKITQANGVDLFQFTFAGDCLVAIELKQHNEYVLVQLTQKNIPVDDASKKSIRLGCDSGWSFYLVNLKSVYEGGIDLRNKNEEFKGLINN